MSPVTILWSMSAAACLTIGVVHLLIWLRMRKSPAYLAFFTLTVSIAGAAAAEMAMMRAETAAEMGTAIRWIHLPLFVAVASIVALIRLYFETGLPWLGHAAWIARLVSLIVNFSVSPNLNYQSIEGVRKAPFLGDVVSVPVGASSAWMMLGQISTFLLMWFILDASVRLWRRGGRDNRRRAIQIGMAVPFFLLVASVRAALVVSNQVDGPLVVMLAFLPMVAVMGYELSHDALRAAQLSGELAVSEQALRESERRMTIAADAARLGMFILDLKAQRLWVSDQLRELFAFPTGEVEPGAFDDRLHPEDRLKRARALERAIETGLGYKAEYRINRPDGSRRWIASHGRAEFDAAGTAVRLLGVCIDVTEQHDAEVAARELSGRLIHAQEDERRRIARELHDDLNQRLALLAVDVELVARAYTEGKGDASLQRMAGHIRELSTEVHDLSYQLHPAKLDQLGLEPAARSWCRDLSRQTGIQIEFSAAPLPANLPPDVALSAFRIIQESLRNVVRHSGAQAARVTLAGGSSGLKLVVEDSGHGFDPSSKAHRAGLGLISMQERMRLVGGTLAVRSQPGQGTRVEATVPLSPA